MYSILLRNVQSTDERHCTCKYIFFGTLQGSNRYQDLIHPFTFFEQLAHGGLESKSWETGPPKREIKPEQEGAADFVLILRF